MTSPIEAVLSQAEQQLSRTGRLDVPAYLAAFPEHAAELEELLPVMLVLYEEKQWQSAATFSQAHAVGLFNTLTATAPPDATPAPAPSGTVSALFGRDRAETGLTVEEQALRSGLPVQAVQQLSEDQTPVASLSNAGIKELAVRVSAPFASLVKELRRLLSMELLTGGTPAAVFTRDQEQSTAQEQQELVEKVRRSTRKRPEKP